MTKTPLWVPNRRSAAMTQAVTFVVTLTTQIKLAQQWALEYRGVVEPHRDYLESSVLSGPPVRFT